MHRHSNSYKHTLIDGVATKRLGLALVVVALSLQSACDHAPASIPAKVPQAANSKVVFTKLPDTSRHLRGLSGLAKDPSGRLWAVPERDRTLLALSPQSNGFLSTAYRLEGVPKGFDTEALASLGDGRFAFGTETQERRKSDQVLIATLEDGRARIVDRLTFDYGAWNIEAEANRGLEGLCYAGGQLLAGSEQPGKARQGNKRRRFAPLASMSPTTHATIKRFRLWLTTETGKLSSLACRERRDKGDIEVLAIERHYKEARVLRFTLPAAGSDIEPEVLVDLAALWPHPPNFEGVEWEGKSLVLLVDNDSGGITGPSLLVRLSWP